MLYLRSLDSMQDGNTNGRLAFAHQLNTIWNDHLGLRLFGSHLPVFQFYPQVTSIYVIDFLSIRANARRPKCGQ